MSVQYRYIYNRSKKEPREKTTLLREKKGKEDTYRESFARLAQIFTLRRRPTDRLAPALSLSLLIIFIPAVFVYLLCGGGGIASSVSVRRLRDRRVLQDAQKALPSATAATDTFFF